MRLLKKAVAATILGISGAVGGFLGWSIVKAPEMNEVMQQPGCTSAMMEINNEYQKIQKPTNEQNLSYLQNLSAVPCMTQIQDLSKGALVAGFGLAALGAVAGLTLVGRKKNVNEQKPSL